MYRTNERARGTKRERKAKWSEFGRHEGYQSSHLFLPLHVDPYEKHADLNGIRRKGKNVQSYHYSWREHWHERRDTRLLLLLLLIASFWSR